MDYHRNNREEWQRAAKCLPLAPLGWVGKLLPDAHKLRSHPDLETLWISAGLYTKFKTCLAYICLAPFPGQPMPQPTPLYVMLALINSSGQFLIYTAVDLLLAGHHDLRVLRIPREENSSVADALSRAEFDQSV